MITQFNYDSQLDKAVLEKLTKTWKSRVAVNKEKLELDNVYDEKIPDFPLELVPFKDHPGFLALPDKQQFRLLAAAWIAYNEKTIVVENSIINPLCSLVLGGAFSGASDPEVKRIIAQTIVDEQFHILMCLEACIVARKRHKLEKLAFPEPVVLTELKNLLAGAANQTQRNLIYLVFASIAEMTINAYLSLLSKDTTIQPLNRISVDLHRQDETAHSVLFRQIVKSIYLNLDDEGKTYFNSMIDIAVEAFVKTDFHAWQAILDFTDMASAETVITYAKSLPNNNLLVRNFMGLQMLLKELDISHLCKLALV